jgi:hypothetical protein
MKELLIGILVGGAIAAMAAVAVAAVIATRLHPVGGGHRYDCQQTARLLVAKLLELSDGDLISEAQAKEYVRRQYLGLVATFGLPMSAVDDVVDNAWAIVREALGFVPDETTVEVQ